MPVDSHTGTRNAPIGRCMEYEREFISEHGMKGIQVNSGELKEALNKILRIEETERKEEPWNPSGEPRLNSVLSRYITHIVETSNIIAYRNL